MQDPQADIKDVVRILLTGSATERLKCIDKCFTPQAEFIHPLLTLRGRRELFDLYQFWYEANTSITFQIPKIVVSQQKDRLILDFDEFLCPLLLPWLPVTIRLVIFLDLQRTPSGFRICRQEDHVLWAQSLLRTLPWAGRAWYGCGRRAVSFSILATMRVLGRLVGFASRHVVPRLPLADRFPAFQAKVRDASQVLDSRVLQRWDAEASAQQPVAA